MTYRTDSEVNAEILERRMALFNRNSHPMVGDFVDFNDCTRRISYIWVYNDKVEVKPVEDWDIQTSGLYGYYLGEGYCSFSGSLYTAIKGKLFQLTDEKRLGFVWFFNRDWWGAHRDRDFQAEFRVWKVNANAGDITW